MYKVSFFQLLAFGVRIKKNFIENVNIDSLIFHYNVITIYSCNQRAAKVFPGL